jgi:hypothetical protein
MKIAFFDLSGTVLQYGEDRPIPLMPQLLSALSDQGWTVAIVSRHSHDHCTSLLAKAGIDCPVSVFSSGQSTKGRAVSTVLNDGRFDEGIFVDDKPENLMSVLQECAHATMRIIGFVGSRQYTPRLSHWCRQHNIELALSPSDLCEGLPAYVDSGTLLNSRVKWSDQELAGLIAGLDHPMSAIAGPTPHLDHRMVLTELLENRNPQDYGPLWRNIAWITCNECLWKALVLTVLRSLSLDVREVLGTAYKHHEYTDALKEYATKTSKTVLRRPFEDALEHMAQGIQEIGVDAELCRIADREMERDRIAYAKKRVQDIFN